MARYRYNPDTRTFWEVDTGEVLPRPDDTPLSSLATHHIIRDECQIESMADGKIYTSKRGYYASLKAKGYRIVEKEELVHKPVVYDRSKTKKFIAEHLKAKGVKVA